MDGHQDAHTNPDATAHAAHGADRPAHGAETVDVDAGERVGDVIGRYRLLERLGEGGFGVVYAAEQTAPVKRRVALKVIKLGMDTRAVVARFEAERQALAMMDHPSIAKVHDAGATQTGRPYFVMELIRGVPITEYCDTHALTTRERLELFIPVCQAVQHAHQKGVIHRDLKPSNVLVALTDDGPAAKVIDFGIAKATSGGASLTDKTIYTSQGQMIGTPEYMSPEQAEMGALDIDTRSDVYSLGVVLYELLTGTLPFDSATLRRGGLSEVQRILRDEKPPRPSTRLTTIAEGEEDETASGGPDSTEIARRRGADPAGLRRQVRGDLDWITLKALEKDRTRRYESAGALAEDIERHLRREPVSAGPPTTAYHVRKFVSRHLAGVGVAAAFVLLLGAGLAVALEGYRRAEAQRARAEDEAGRARAAFGFISDMFGAVDPAVAKGREVTVLDVLDPAAARAGESLKHRPEAEGSVREALAEAYFQIGRYPQAQENFERALELRTRTLGADDRETLTTMHNLAAVFAQMGKFDEAERMLQRAIDGRQRVLGGRNPDTLASLSLLCFVLQNKGDLAGAERLLRQVIEAQAASEAGSKRDVHESRNGLADLLHSAGRLEEAERAAATAARESAAALGADDPLAIEAESIHASVLGELGRNADAEVSLRRVLDAKRRVLGPEHPGTMTSQNALAQVLKKAKKNEEAEALLRQCIEAATKNYSAEHATTLTYTNNLAGLLHTTGRLDEAEQMYRTTLETLLRTSGESNMGTLSTMTNLGELLTQRNQAEEGLTLLRRALVGLEATLPADHWMLGAERAYIGECLMALGQREEAEKELLAGQKALEAALGAQHSRTREASADLVKLYEAWGRPERAAEWRVKSGDSGGESPKR